MRIRSIEIENLRGIRHLAVSDLGSLVLLTGPNGTGKSTVLEAISRWKEAIGAYYGAPPVQGELVTTGAETAEIEVELEITDAERQFVIQRSDVVPGTFGTSLRASVGLNRDGQPYRTDADFGLHLLLQALDAGSVGSFEHLGPYRRMPLGWQQQIDMNPIPPEVDKQTRLYNVEGKFAYLKGYVLALTLRDLKHFKDTGEEIDSLAHLKAVFNEFFSPKKLLGADWVDTPQGPSMRILVETPLGKIDVDQLSAGELEVFSVFGNLDRLKLANSVLLYDEPELHLNAGLERRLLPALEQLAGNSQLIVASHSAQLATAAPWDSIIRMTVEGDNQATRLSEEAERIELYSLLGADVPVQLVSRLIVFVEGLESSLDLAVMRRLLGPHLPGVEFIATGPANAVVALSERAAALMSEAAAYDSYFGVRDRDFLSDGDVEKAAADSAERLHVWRRYHIENYLIETPALHRVAERLGLGLSLDQVEDSVRAIADSMKEVVVAQALAARVNNRIERFDLAVSGGADPVGVTMSKIRRSRESFTAGFDDSALSVFADSVRSEIEVSWSENWKALCPGRPLLRRLAGEWNLPYDRLRSLILAELAAEDDVDEEIKQLRTRLRELTPTA